MADCESTSPAVLKLVLDVFSTMISNMRLLMQHFTNLSCVEREIVVTI